jgi:hypothetical protein
MTSNSKELLTTFEEEFKQLDYFMVKIHKLL